MEERHRNIIRKNYVVLRDKCNIFTLLPLLLKKNVFSSDILERYQDNRSDIDKKRDLFLDIQYQGPEAFDKLVASFRESGQNYLADLLDGQKETNMFKHYTKALGSLAYVLLGALPIDDEILFPVLAVINAHFFNHYIQNMYLKHKQTHPFQYPNLILPDNLNININLRTEPLKIMVKPGKFFFDNPALNAIPVYKTSSKNREPPRMAAEVDSENLEELFTQIGLKVQKYRDLERDKMEDVIIKFAANEDHKKADMAVIVIMGHGNESVILASDGKAIETNWIEQQLNNVYCPNLQKKPKLIIYQVCRGHFHDHGTRRRTETDSGGRGEPIRTLDDMLIANATVKGYKAHRDTHLGSWYIQCLCEIFMEHAHDKHVEDLLVMVDSKLENLLSEFMTMQTSAFTNHGFKRCYLHPGIYLENGIKKSFS